MNDAYSTEETEQSIDTFDIAIDYENLEEAIISLNETQELDYRLAEAYLKNREFERSLEYFESCLNNLYKIHENIFE